MSIRVPKVVILCVGCLDSMSYNLLLSLLTLDDYMELL
jgi:hypothetical protein